MMIRTALLTTALFTATLLTVAAPSFAQEDCSSCEDQTKTKTAKACGDKAGAEEACAEKSSTEASCHETAAAGDWAKKMGELQAKAAKGDVRAKAALGAAMQDCGTSCAKTMTEKVVKLEAAAAKGDEKAKAKLGQLKWTMIFASVRAAPLSEQVVFYAKASGKGCEISKQSMATLMKETGAKDQADLSAKLIALEAKAAGGSDESKATIVALRAKIAPQKKAAPKVALSARVEKLAVAAKAGDKAAQERLRGIVASMDSKPETIVADVKAFEAKAHGGCKTSMAKLTAVEAELSGDADDCSECASASKCCDEAGSDSKPVKQ